MIERLDYPSVGLMAGLEVHQQLLTEHKLFCRCPAGLYTESHDGEVLRHMRPTLSELGEYDGTALMEFKTKKEIIYLLNHKNVCTYEMDDTPPFLVNQAALDVAIEICLSMNMDIIDEVHIARKQYLDGSIPTGFQRTAIVGLNGCMPFQGAKPHDHPRLAGRGLLPRSERQGAPHRLADRPPGDAADGDRHRPRAFHARGGPRRDPALRPGRPQHRPRADRHRRRAARTSTSASAAGSGWKSRACPRPDTP